MTNQDENNEAEITCLAMRLAKEANTAMPYAEIEDVEFDLINQYASKSQLHQGRLSFFIQFKPDSPTFLTTGDHKIWNDQVRKLTLEKFGYNMPSTYSLMDIGVSFEAKSFAELHQLTPEKETAIKNELAKIKRYAAWHYTAVTDYENVRQAVKQAHVQSLKVHLDRLENLVG